MDVEENDFTLLVISLIDKYDEALVGDSYTSEYDCESEGYEGVYAEFNYQIDDRIDDNGGRDYEDIISENIAKDLKKEYGITFGVSLDRRDAFPNGYASYILTVDS